MKTASISIIIPAHNEEKNIEKTIKSVLSVLEKYTRTFEILIINDASLDKTGEIANKLSKTNKRIRVLHNNPNLGFGGSYWKGVENVRYQYCMMVWGDNAHTQSSLHKVLSKLGEADVVIPNYTNMETRTRIRRIISYFFTKFINLITRLNVKYYNGTTLYKTKYLTSIPRRSRGFSFQAEVLAYTLKKGASYIQVDVLRKNKPDGPSAIFSRQNLVDVFKSVWWLFWQCRV